MWAATFLSLLCSGLPAHGQAAREKPYQQWSYRDVADVLSNSPWSQMKQNNEDSHGGRGVVNVRLHSALPVRQALARSKQIALNYEKWTVAEKAKFDSEAKEFLECPGCAKYYILTYRILSRDSLEDRRKLRNLTLDELKSHVFLLNDKGERRDLALFMAPESGNRQSLVYGHAIFFFERFDEQGKPLLSTDNKKFYFQIDEKAPNLKFLPVKKITFEIRKLIQNGEVVF